MRVTEIGEFGLIQRLTHVLERAGVAASSPQAAFPLVIGIGDDAAAWRTDAVLELSTTDTVVEGVHFTRETTPWKDLGWKAMAANLSDIAAMGGMPLYALATLGLPQDAQVADLEALYEGLAWACQEHGAVVAGGDIVRSPVFFLTIALSGYTRDAPLKRSSARSGDLLALSGPVGGSRGGLEMMLKELPADASSAEALRFAHRHPQPRLSEGRILVQEGVLCAMDLSDGLYDDLGKFMAASRCAAELEAWRIPFPSALERVFPGQATEMALAGGEDYELLFAAPPAVVERALARIPSAAIVGRVVAGAPGNVSVTGRDGKPLPVGKLGWDHFRS
ncbi:MAG: thiamine-phosphate kinase [Chloroflexi bacterium]|nr:thiamine-phosphate kinase [Chloroflexota bacterium]